MPPCRLGEDDAGVVQVHRAGAAGGGPRRAPAPRRRAQCEIQTGRRGHGGRGRGEDGAVDGPGGGGEVHRVVRLALVVVGGQEPQCSEGPRVVLARVGGWEAETRHGDLRVSGWLGGTCRTSLAERRLWGALGQGLGGGCGLRGEGRSLPTVRLLREEEIQPVNSTPEAHESFREPLLH